MGIVRSGWSGLLPSETWKIKGLEVGSYALANTSTPNTHTVDGVTFWRGAKRAQGSYNAGGPSYYEAWEICTNYQFRLDLPIQSYFEDNAYVDINNNNAYVGGSVLHNLKPTAGAWAYSSSLVGFKDGYILSSWGYGVDGTNRRILQTDHPIILNTAPTVTNVQMILQEDIQSSVKLVAADKDSGDTHVFSLVNNAPATAGVASIAGNTLTFVPKPNWNGTTSFTYRASDGKAFSNTATVTVTVTPVNDVPSVANATLTIDEDTVGTLTLGVTDVDLQFEGDSHTWSIVTAPNPAHGTASITGNKLTFTPAKDWNGTTTLTYRARDSKGANSNTATVTITVRPVNDAPVASNGTLTVAEDTSGTVTLVATDVDGDSLTYSVVTQPNAAHGTVTISGDKATFTPKPNWNGTTTFTYRTNDGKANSNTATVTVTVTPVNDTPSVANATLAIDEDTVGTLTLGVTDVDLQFEGDSHTWSIVTAPNAAHGTASITGNKLTFTPAQDWNGTTTLTYRARDSKGANSNTATVTITVRPVNDAPVASNGTLTVAEDTSGTVTLVATDVEGDSLTYSVVTQPNAAHGTVTISGNKATFTPKPNWNGTTSFTYRANDGTVNSNTATVTVTVTPVNDTPSVANATLGIDEDTVGTLILGVTDVDLQFEGDSHTWSIVTAPNAAHGTASITGNKLTFTPAKDWNGTTTLTYRARDSKGANSNTATVTITVRPVNDKPIVQDVTRSIPEDTSVTIALELEDVDLQFEGDSHTFEILDSLPAEEGTYSLTGSSLQIVPTKDWNGTITLRYLARDSHGLASDIKTIQVEVTYVNDPPVATGGSILAREGMASDHIDPWVEDVDLPYGDVHTFEIVEQPANGQAKVIFGRLEYTPNPQYFGPDKFVIRATDREGEFVDGEVDVTVETFNYAPTDIIPGTLNLYAGIGGTAELAVTDPNTWGSYTLSVVQQPAHGTASVEGNTLLIRTDGADSTTIRVMATDQDGLTFEKNIVVNFQSAWEMFRGREVRPSGAEVSIPAVTHFMTRRNGTYALQLNDAAVIDELGSDIIAVVTPDSPVGLKVEHRDLAPEIGMRLKPTTLSESYLEAKIAGLEAGKAGVAKLYLSRADMQGPVYSIPVHAWAPAGELTAPLWEVRQGIERTTISYEPSASNVCAIMTTENMAKARNVLQEPICLVEWQELPEEWRSAGNTTSLAIEAYGRTLGQHPVKASAYVFDPQGGKHWIADFSHALTVLSAADSVGLSLQPAPEQVYQSVQDLTLLLRRSAGRDCDVTTTETIARNAARQWQSKPMCFIRWTNLPEGMSQSGTWHIPQLVGSPTVLGEQTISWKASVFTPSGEEIDLTMGSHEMEVIVPPAIEIEPPASNLIGENTYAVSQLGGFVGSLTVSSLPASIDLKITRDGEELESATLPSFGRGQRINRYVDALERPLWSMTPYTVEAKYTRLPAVQTIKELQLLAVPHPQILPVILNDERRVLDTASMPINVQILDTRYPEDGYRISAMGDWDVRLLMTTGGINYEPVTEWEPISDDGQVSFELDLELLTNKVVRVIAEARVRSPVPEYASIRKTPYPLSLTVLNGEPLDGYIQALRVVGPAPMRSTFYAMTVSRYETGDIGNVRWEWSHDEGATWETISNEGPLPQRLSMTFAKGSYLLRAELTNKHSGEKSLTPHIEVIAYEVPKARLDGPGNVFIQDTGKFKITDMEGQPLDTSNLVIEWSEDRGKTWISGEDTYELTREKQERVYLQARLKYADSPDDDRVYRTLRAGVAFRSVRPPRVQIIGPLRSEVGKEAVWTANMMMPYPRMGLTMDGYFILPDGQEVHAMQATYTPTMEDFEKEKSYLGFMGWINEYEDKGGKGLTQRRLVFWSYDWPEWKIQAKTSAMFAPADMTLQTRSLGMFREFEGLTMEWDIPIDPGIEVVKDTSQTSRVIRVVEPGTYTFGVHVSDERGNYTYAETEMTFEQPIPYEVSLSWSGDNPAMRAPLGVLIRPSITGGHPKDRIETRTYSLKGEPLANAGMYGKATLDKGIHEVSLDITSQMGHAARGSVTIKVEENKAPSCSVEVREGSSSWLARAGCTDEDGRVVRHMWFVDGEQQSLSSSSISVPKWRYPNGEPVITLVGIDDSGAESDPVSSY
jgi:hypothetical protein